MAGSSYVAALICVVTFLVGQSHLGEQSARGLNVLIARPCPDGWGGDSRDLLVRLLPGGKLWLNDHYLSEEALRKAVASEMVTRAERVILLAADSRVPYGDVVTFASTLQRDTPDLHISLVTRSVIGPVDPTEMNGDGAGGPLLKLCNVAPS
jgi:biopolymer transport protein ExbD